MFATRNVLGILLGVATGVITANALNHFLGWEIWSMAIGIFSGLEVSFWCTNPKLTLQTHRKVLEVMIHEDTRKALYKVLFVVTSLFGIAAASAVSISYSGHWTHNFLVGLDIWDETTTDIVFMVTMLASMLCSIIYCICIYRWQDNNPDKDQKFLLYSVLNILACIGIGVLSPLLCVLAVLAIALLVGFLVLVCAILPVIELAGKNEVGAITTGVITGSLAGLAYGWTHLAFGPTTIAIAIGAVVGLGIAYITHCVGKSRWFVRFSYALTN